MISGVRDNTLALACLQRGLPAVHGRRIDLFTARDHWAISGNRCVQRLDAEELSRAFRAVVDILVEQISNLDEELCLRLQVTLKMLIDI